MTVDKSKMGSWQNLQNVHKYEGGTADLAFCRTGGQC